MSSWIDKAKDFIKGNPDKARDALEKAEDVVNERTGGKYAEQVDKGSDMVEREAGAASRDRGRDCTRARSVTRPGARAHGEPDTDTTPTEAGPAGADSGTTQGGGPVPDLPSEGDVTLGDPPPAPPSR